MRFKRKKQEDLLLSSCKGSFVQLISANLADTDVYTPPVICFSFDEIVSCCENMIQNDISTKSVLYRIGYFDVKSGKLFLASENGKIKLGSILDVLKVDKKRKENKNGIEFEVTVSG